MFARKADDDLASLAGKLEEIVAANKDKKACATVVCLGAKDAYAENLKKIAGEKKLKHVPLTVSKDGESGPEAYSINKDVTFTVVVYDKEKKVTNTFAWDKLDAKNQDEAIAAFCKVLGVEAPKGK